MDTIVIVGAGQAGGRAAETLRAEGYGDAIILIGQETERPYQRPPLSKGYLLGNEPASELYLHDTDWYRANSIQLNLDTRVVELDRPNHRIRLADGRHVDYTDLLLATGASPRRLKTTGLDLPGVHHLRDIGDSDRLAAALRAAKRVVVVGAGWIGLETAAAAREYDCEVTVVEPQPTPLWGTLGPEMGRYFHRVHDMHGVDIRLGRSVTEIIGDDQVAAVVTDDGARIPADVVIMGTGAVPNTDLAEAAGLAVDNGVIVDGAMRTEDPHVYAAGDVARAYYRRYDRRIRVEHVTNADKQSVAAAKSMLGQPIEYDELPFFYTDQYDLGMEFTGYFAPGEYDAVTTRGDVPGNAFYAFWTRDRRVVAGMHVNQWDDGIEPVEALIRSDNRVDPEALADVAVPLSTLAG